MILKIPPEAQKEFQHSAAYYKTISPELSRRFIEEVDEAFHRIVESPLIPAYFQPPARAIFLDHFPFSIIYIVEDDAIDIVAVMHQKRRPGYWRKRI